MEGHVLIFAYEHPVAGIGVHKRPQFLHQLMDARLLDLEAHQLLIVRQVQHIRVKEILR